MVNIPAVGRRAAEGGTSARGDSPTRPSSTGRRSLPSRYSGLRTPSEGRAAKGECGGRGYRWCSKPGRSDVAPSDQRHENPINLDVRSRPATVDGQGSHSKARDDAYPRSPVGSPIAAVREVRSEQASVRSQRNQRCPSTGRESATAAAAPVHSASQQDSRVASRLMGGRPSFGFRAAAVGNSLQPGANHSSPPPLHLPLLERYPGLRCVHARPPIYVCDDFLSSEACDALIASATPLLRRSMTHYDSGNAYSNGRTSLTCHMDKLKEPCRSACNSGTQTFPSGGHPESTRLFSESTP